MIISSCALKMYYIDHMYILRRCQCQPLKTKIVIPVIFEIVVAEGPDSNNIGSSRPGVLDQCPDEPDVYPYWSLEIRGKISFSYRCSMIGPSFCRFMSRLSVLILCKFVALGALFQRLFLSELLHFY